MVRNKRRIARQRDRTVTRLAIHARAGLLAILALLLPLAASAAPFAAFVMDGRTGKTLYSQNADTRLHPASLTKMMTLYLAFTAVERGQVSLDTKFTVSSNAAGKPPSRLGLRAGQKIELRYLIRAAAIKSANDAATVIAEGLAGSEAKFGQQMTAMAPRLGMTNSNFVNPHGLTANGHYSTAHDMTVLGRHLFYDFPQYYNIFSRRSADAGVAKVSSTNARFLDAYDGADGIKTGYTRAAGFNLTASAQRDGKRIIATVMGGTSTAQRNATMMQLLDQGFSSAPRGAREVPPAAPALVAAPRRTVRVARDDTPATVPQAVVLDRSVAPVPAAPARDSLAVALGAALSAPPVAAAEAGGVGMMLAASSRPLSRPEGSTPDAAAPAVAPPPVAATAAVPGGLTSSMRPPRRDRRAEATPPAVEGVRQAAAASTFPVAPAVIDQQPAPESGVTLALASSPAPAPRAETVILAAMGEGDQEPAAAVVSRASTREGRRGWGVSLGMQRSRDGAEQLLLRTALQESSVLDHALRQVVDTNKGFDARFISLTKAEANLACEKLAARAMACAVIGG